MKKETRHKRIMDQKFQSRWKSKLRLTQIDSETRSPFKSVDQSRIIRVDDKTTRSKLENPRFSKLSPNVSVDRHSHQAALISIGN